MTTPTRSDIAAVRETQARLASHVTHCAMCADRPDGPGVTSGLCGECEAIMDRAVEEDASDFRLIMMAVSAYGSAKMRYGSDPRIGGGTETDRAYTRVMRLLRQVGVR